MKITELTNYKTMFPGLFSLYVSETESGDQEVRELFWRCDVCGEVATEETTTGAVEECVLSCSCRSNCSFATSLIAEMNTAANIVPEEEFVEDDSLDSSPSWLSRVVDFFSNIFS